MTSAGVGSPDLGELPAHAEGRRATTANELVWLQRWLVDELDGVSTNDFLGLLIATTRDPALLTPAFLAEHHVVHPMEFIEYNRGRFELREDRGTWIIRHRNRDDARLPLRVRPTQAGRWELIEPVIDLAALRATTAAAAAEMKIAHELFADELSGTLGDATIAVGIGPPQHAPARLMGAPIEALADVAMDDAPSCERVEWSGGTWDRDALGSAVVGLLTEHTGLDLGGLLPRAHHDTWRVWLARRGRAPVATVGFAVQEGHCAVSWIVSAGGARPAALVLVEALREAAALEDAVTTSARVTDRATEDLLVGLGYQALGA